MQDEINEKIVSLTIQTGKKGAHLTAEALKKAMQKYLAAAKRTKAAGKARDKNDLYRGKQTVERLMEQKENLTNIEITNQNIKPFERIANKYGIDFALKKDRSVSPPRYLVFFKAKDLAVMTAAFKEYSTKALTKSKKPSVRELLAKSLQKVMQMTRERTKQKDRGMSR